MEGLFFWRAAFKNGKRSHVRTDDKVFMAAGQNWQQLGGRDRMHLELNHLSAGAWSEPVDIDSREPEIKGTFPAKNGGIPQPYTGGGKYYLMNGLDASQGNHALTDGSVLQGTDADLSSAIQAHLNDGGGVFAEKTAAVRRPNITR